MTMHVFSMNIAGGDSRGHSRAWCIAFGIPACPRVPRTSGSLTCRDTFACPEGVRS